VEALLKDHLIEPAPPRGRRIPWSVFLKAHWQAIAASDFFGPAAIYRGWPFGVFAQPN
jgi:hypothetical protein